MVVGEPVGDPEGLDDAALDEAREPASAEAQPESTPAREREGVNPLALETRGVALVVDRETDAVEAREALESRDPEEAAGALDDGPHRVLRQSVVGVPGSDAQLREGRVARPFGAYGHT